MTTLYLDTEFNGFDGQFISAALVAEDGREWYQATFCKNPTDWVAKHVIPVIEIKLLMFEELQKSLRKFLQQYVEVTIICDWPRDVEHFCRLLMLEDGSGRMIRTPRLTFVVDTRLSDYTDSLKPHNALEDAKALRLVDLQRQIRQINLADPDVEPSEHDLRCIMADVAIVANAKAKKAKVDFFKGIAKTIESKETKK